MTSRDAILRWMANDERNARDLARYPWSYEAVMCVIADCAQRLLAARDTAPELAERAEQTLRLALERRPEAR